MVDTRKRRHPEGSLLYQVVERHLEEFLVLMKAVGRMTGFIEQAFRSYLTCGIIEKAGYVLVACEACGHQEKVALSCKQRGVCPWCATRKMLSEARQLVEQVLPVGKYRHVVVSYPFEVNKKLAFRPEVLSKVERAVTKGLLRWQAERCQCQGGGVLFRHRFRGDLEMGIHDHVLMVDFSYVPVAWDARTGAIAVWQAIETQQQEIEALAAQLWKRIKGVLARAGITIEAKKSSGQEAAKKSQPEQLELFEVAGGKKERSVAAVGRTQEDELEEPTAGQWARVDGLHVYVSEPIDGEDRGNLERLCQYLLRPAFVPERLRQRSDGKLTYRLRRKDKDGNTVLVLTPVQFLRRLMDLIPAPRQRMRKLFGILAPRAAKRREVMPKRAVQECVHKQVAGPREVSADVAPRQNSNWVEVLQRTWGEDMKCARCGAQMRTIVKVDIPEAVNTIGRGAARVLHALGARAPPQTAA